MLRTQFSLTYTLSAGIIETDTIDRMIALCRQPERTPEQAQTLETLQDNLPTVEQIRITVATVNGLQNARYSALYRQATEYFTEQTGLPLPLPKEVNEDGEEVSITLDDEQDAILSVAFGAAGALAATVKYETRETRPIVSAAGMKFEDVEWAVSQVPSEIATVAGWVENCPATLQTAWSNKAFDANPSLWRKKSDEAAKNFDAVSVN